MSNSHDERRKSDNWQQDLTGRLREQVYDDINLKRWSQAKNLGSSDGIPQGWVLCNIGPEDAFIELTDEIVNKFRIDEDGEFSAENAKEFWTGVCSLIKSENFQYILGNSKTYSDFLIRGTLLLYDVNESYLKKFIERNLEKIGFQLKQMLSEQNFLPKDLLGDGYIKLTEVATQLEKDFLAIKHRTETYYVTCLKNHMKTLLRHIETESLNEEIAKDNNKADALEFLKMDFYKILTDRQREICDRLAESKSQKEIGAELGITDRTIRTEINLMKEKLKDT